MRLLLIEDEIQLQQQIKQQLSNHGFSVDTQSNGKEGLYTAQEFPFDLAIIDIGLPDISGIDIIKQFRLQKINLPILILTARSSWQDKVSGLEAGADDYLVKPFHIEELIARINALIRRASHSISEQLKFSNLSIIPEKQQVFLNKQAIELTQFEFSTLEYLMRRPGQVISKDILTGYLYPHNEESNSNVIEVIIARLRKKLDPYNTLKPIETLRARGYRFVLEAE